MGILDKAAGRECFVLGENSNQVRIELILAGSGPTPLPNRIYPEYSIEVCKGSFRLFKTELIVYQAT